MATEPDCFHYSQEHPSVKLSDWTSQFSNGLVTETLKGFRRLMPIVQNCQENAIVL